MSIDPKFFAQRRMALGFTQAQLAEGICTASMISQFENGKAILSLDKLKQFAERLQIEIEIDIKVPEVANSVNRFSRPVIGEILKSIQDLAMMPTSLEALGKATADVLKQHGLLTSSQYAALVPNVEMEPEPAVV